MGMERVVRLYCIEGTSTCRACGGEQPGLSRSKPGKFQDGELLVRELEMLELSSFLESVTMVFLIA